MSKFRLQSLHPPQACKQPVFFVMDAFHEKYGTRDSSTATRLHFEDFRREYESKELWGTWI